MRHCYVGLMDPQRVSWPNHKALKLKLGSVGPIQWPAVCRVEIDSLSRQSVSPMLRYVLPVKHHPLHHYPLV